MLPTQHEGVFNIFYDYNEEDSDLFYGYNI